MATTTKTLTIFWQTNGTSMTDEEIGLLFEVFAPMPTINEYSLRSGVIGLGKSRILVANQDQIQDSLRHYINILSTSQQKRVKCLLKSYLEVINKVNKYTEAEKVKLRANAPEEERNILRKSLQVYIPIFYKDEVDDLMDQHDSGGGNFIRRG